ncbi:MAG: adenosylcobinamide-GDP ribazoletransferase [Mycobacteriaceae bacterium]
MRSLLLATGMFTVVPVRPVDADRATAAGALRWFPLLGAALGLAGGVAALVFWHGGASGSPLLGALVAVLAVALATRGLHLDGLADLADGLGSRAPAPRALDIMRAGDVGPFGVVALLGALALQATALATVLATGSRGQGLVVLAVVAAGARLAVLDAARPGVTAARPGGFGALVAGSAAPVWTLVQLAVLLVAGWALLVLSTSALAALWLPAAVLVALVVARVLTGHVLRRLGGVTRDVFGALVEVSTTVALLVLAGAATGGWL